MNNVVGEDIVFKEPVAPWMTIDNNSNNSSKDIIKSSKVLIVLIDVYGP